MYPYLFLAAGRPTRLELELELEPTMISPPRHHAGAALGRAGQCQDNFQEWAENGHCLTQYLRALRALRVACLRQWLFILESASCPRLLLGRSLVIWSLGCHCRRKRLCRSDSVDACWTCGTVPTVRRLRTNKLHHSTLIRFVVDQ